jgi:hypothetical protein
MNDDNGAKPISDNIRKWLDTNFKNISEAYLKLSPPFSTSTFHRAIKGFPVGNEIRDFLRGKYTMATQRLYSDQDLDRALEMAQTDLVHRKGRSVHIDDLKRDLWLMLSEEFND